MFLSKTKEVIFVKRKNWICLLLVLVMALAMLPTAAFAANGTPEGNWADYAADAFAGGTGAKDDPYPVSYTHLLMPGRAHPFLSRKGCKSDPRGVPLGYPP